MQLANVQNMTVSHMDLLPSYEQGAILAKHITNLQTDGYSGSIVGTQLKVAGCDLFSAGQIYEDDQTKAISIFNECKRSYKKY